MAWSCHWHRTAYFSLPGATNRSSGTFHGRPDGVGRARDPRKCNYRDAPRERFHTAFCFDGRRHGAWPWQCQLQAWGIYLIPSLGKSKKRCFKRFPWRIRNVSLKASLLSGRALRMLFIRLRIRLSIAPCSATQHSGLQPFPHSGASDPTPTVQEKASSSVRGTISIRNA